MGVFSGSAESLVDLLIGDSSSLVGGEDEVLECQRQRVGTGLTFPLLTWRILSSLPISKGMICTLDARLPFYFPKCFLLLFQNMNDPSLVV